LTVPDVKAALARFEKLGVEVFKPLGVASNETIPVPDGMTPIVPGYAEVYKQIAMIRVPLVTCDRMLIIGSRWLLYRISSSNHRETLDSKRRLKYENESSFAARQCYLFIYPELCHCPLTNRNPK